MEAVVASAGLFAWRPDRDDCVVIVDFDGTITKAEGGWGRKGERERG